MDLALPIHDIKQNTNLFYVLKIYLQVFAFLHEDHANEAVRSPNSASHVP